MAGFQASHLRTCCTVVTNLFDKTAKTPFRERSSKMMRQKTDAVVSPIRNNNIDNERERCRVMTSVATKEIFPNSGFVRTEPKLGIFMP